MSEQHCSICYHNTIRFPICNFCIEDGLIKARKEAKGLAKLLERASTFCQAKAPDGIQFYGELGRAIDNALDKWKKGK